MNPSVSTTPMPFSAATRMNQSITASIEKRALEWMARHGPRWLTSDQLTVLGLLAQICAGIGYAASRFHPAALLLVNLCIVLNWLGDSLDGTLARVRHHQRPRYGFYVDHMVDVFGAVALMSGLACSGFLHAQTAAAMLIVFLILSAESYLATYTLSSFQMSHGPFGPTEIRLLLIVGNFALLRSPYAALFGHRMLLFDLGGIIAVIGMSAMALFASIVHTRKLYREEPLP